MLLLQLIVGVRTTGSLPVGYLLFEMGYFLLMYGVPRHVGGAWKTLVCIGACMYGTGVFEFVLFCMLQSLVLLVFVNFANLHAMPGIRARFVRGAEHSLEISGHRFLAKFDDEDRNSVQVLAERWNTARQSVPTGVPVTSANDADPLECPYCCDRKKNRVMNCGHTGCNVCVEKFKTCPECRTDVFRVQTIFV
jgi:hypothetical protein